MIKAKLTWKGDAAQQVVFDAGFDALKRITLFYLNAVSNALNVPNSGERRRRKHDTKTGKKGSSYTVYRNPSKPGEPPHKITGHLRGGLVYDLDKENLVSRVGILSNVKYGAFLEYGTRKMAERSFLKRTLDKVLPQLRALAG